MKKPSTIFLIVLTLVALMSASCTPPLTPVPIPAAPTSAPAAAPTTVAATPAAKAAAAATPANRPGVPAPAGDSRPLAKLSTTDRNERFGGPAPVSIKAGTIYQVTIVTGKGNIVAELYADTPEGANNFVSLALGGFYDGLTFHRVEPGFVIQGGDPLGDGTGGPGYTIPAEIKHTHARGALAWARTGDQVNPERRSSGSQFYITLQATPFLDGQYSVFGQVVQGLDVIDKIAIGDKIQRIDVKEVQASQLPTPAPTPLPKAPKSESGRPLAKLSLEQRAVTYNMAPDMTIKTTSIYTATMKTPKGDVVFSLDANGAPKAVNNFILLANLGFYDGMPIAFAEPELYVVSGSPDSRPDSDIGYTLKPEVGPLGSTVITGTVAMYPSFDPLTNDVLASGSQFFISLTAVVDNQTPLSLLGKVVSGLDIVSKLTMSDTLTSITIAEK